MKLSAIIAPLVAAKVPHDQIMAVILAFEGEEMNALEHRRKMDADRQSRKRERDLSRDITLRHSDGSLVRGRDTRAVDNLLPTEIVSKEEKKVSKQRATRLPTEFEPDLSWAEAQGLSSSQAKTEAAKFRDYWSSKGANATKTDWAATWRNWARTAAERMPRAGPGKPKNIADAATDLLREFQDADLRSDQSNPSLPAPIPNLPAPNGWSRSD